MVMQQPKFGGHLWVGVDLVGRFPGLCVCVGGRLSAEGIGPSCPASGRLTVYITVCFSFFPG